MILTTMGLVTCKVNSFQINTDYCLLQNDNLLVYVMHVTFSLRCRDSRETGIF